MPLLMEFEGTPRLTVEGIRRTEKAFDIAMNHPELSTEQQLLETMRQFPTEAQGDHLRSAIEFYFSSFIVEGLNGPGSWETDID